MLNSITLHGRLTHDMELKTTPNGISVCRFCVAVESGYGEKKRVDFIDCVAWRGTAEFLCKHFAKGQETALCGRLETQTWEDKEGRKRKTVKVNVREADFCGKRESSPPAGESELLEGFEELLDDDLPF